MYRKVSEKLTTISHVRYEAAIRCSDRTHLKCTLGAELLHCLISRMKIIPISVTLNLLGETADILLLVCLQESSSLTSNLFPVKYPSSYKNINPSPR